MASKPLIISHLQIQTAEVGSDALRWKLRLLFWLLVIATLVAVALLSAWG